LLLESPTWRANPDWGARVGYVQAALDRVNTAAMRFVAEIADAWRDRVPQVRLVGVLGPRGDGYRASAAEPSEAAAYHLPQVRALAAGGAELIVVYTLTGVGEAAGVALAARDVGLPVGIGLTVELDGRLPDGTPLADAIEAVDSICAPTHYGVNCAHPTHIERGMADQSPQLRRIAVVRANASELSHAELDEAEVLDDGDPVALAAAVASLRERLPGLRVVGGCCGTDARHVAAMWGVSA
jgi:S-methylmethionine-dependent homocysteine/selenocysteine methylase